MADANLILNSFTSVIVAIVGGWQVHFVRSQLNSKDASIEALKSAITTNKAVIERKEDEIAALKAKSAPAIVKEHAAVQEYANTITEQKQKAEAESKHWQSEAARIGGLSSSKNEVAAIYGTLQGLKIGRESFDANLGPLMTLTADEIKRQPTVQFYISALKGYVAALQAVDLQARAYAEKFDSLTKPESGQ